MESLTNKLFWLRTAERAIKTFAQSLALVFLGDSAYNVINVNWPESLGLAATGALLSVLTSVGSSTVGVKTSPSLIEKKVEEQVVERAEAGRPVGDPPRVLHTDAAPSNIVAPPGFILESKSEL